MTSVRLTTGRAIVRSMARLYVERDGHQQRFTAGASGTIGHGIVAGLGQVVEDLGDAERMPYRPRNDGGQVHDRVTLIVVPTPPGTRVRGFGEGWEVTTAGVRGHVGVQKARLGSAKARGQRQLG